MWRVSGGSAHSIRRLCSACVPRSIQTIHALNSFQPPNTTQLQPCTNADLTLSSSQSIFYTHASTPFTLSNLTLSQSLTDHTTNAFSILIRHTIHALNSFNQSQTTLTTPQTFFYIHAVTPFALSILSTLIHHTTNIFYSYAVKPLTLPFHSNSHKSYFCSLWSHSTTNEVSEHTPFTLSNLIIFPFSILTPFCPFFTRGVP